MFICSQKAWVGWKSYIIYTCIINWSSVLEKMFLDSDDNCHCTNMKSSDFIIKSYILWARIENNYQSQTNVITLIQTLLISSSFFQITNILQSASCDTRFLVNVNICVLHYGMLRSNGHIQKRWEYQCKLPRIMLSLKRKHYTCIE